MSVPQPELEWRVVYADENPDTGEIRVFVALTGRSQESVQWMFDALADPEESPDVVWARIECGEFHPAGQYERKEARPTPNT